MNHKHSTLITGLQTVGSVVLCFSTEAYFLPTATAHNLFYIVVIQFSPVQQLVDFLMNLQSLFSIMDSMDFNSSVHVYACVCVCHVPNFSNKINLLS